MKPEVEALLDKARRSIRTAEQILKEDEADFAGSRAYYAMFYVAEALLLERGFVYSTHSAVIARFGKEFAKTGLLHSKFHNYLIKSQDRRNIGDYAIGDHLTKAEVREMIKWAKEFMLAAESFLKQVL
jgi:uncharacterized protein (UPF0332 family)